MFSDKKSSGFSDRQLKTPRSKYIFSRQKELVLDLITPLAGERLLDIGCGTGDNMQIFGEKWCSLTGIDSSREKLEEARKKHGDRAEFIMADPEDIPFSDNEFDIVTIINFIEIARNPQKVIEEAVRVCRSRVFIGFLNNYSLFGTRQSLKETFGFILSKKMRFYSFPAVKHIVEDIAGDTVMKWGSVLYFPGIVYDFFEEMEEMFPLRKNPFGAFVGITFPVKYTYRTAQSPVVNSFKLNNANARNAAPEVVRDMLRHTHK